MLLQITPKSAKIDQVNESITRKRDRFEYFSQDYTKF